jgi:DNA repair ATPase RecN
MEDLGESSEIWSIIKTNTMSIHSTLHISRMNNEQNDWLRGLEFYKQELQIHTHRLSDVSGMYDSKADLKPNVEHFQNQFIVQRENIDHLAHDLGSFEKKVSHETQEMAQHINASTLAEHDVLRDRYTTLETTINDLRHEHNKFLAKYI